MPLPKLLYQPHFAPTNSNLAARSRASTLRPNASTRIEDNDGVTIMTPSRCAGTLVAPSP
jgi:hypothetical protein